MKASNSTQQARQRLADPRPSPRFKLAPAVAGTVLLAAALMRLACLTGEGADLTGSESEQPVPAVTYRVGIGFSGEPRAFDIQPPEPRREAIQIRLQRLGSPLFRYLDRIDGRGGEPLRGFHTVPEVQTVVLVGLTAWTPIGIAAGPAWGAAEGISEPTIRRDEAVVTNVLAKLAEPGGLQKALFILLSGQLPDATVLSNRLMDSSEFRRPSLVDAVAPFPSAYRAATRPRCERAVYGDCDVAVTLKLLNWGLTGLDQADPALSLSLLIRGTICNLHDGTQGPTFYARYEDRKAKLREWSQDGGVALQQELLRALESVAGQIAAQVPQSILGPVLAGHPNL